MKYDVNIYVGKNGLPLFGRSSLTPSEAVQFLSLVLRRQMLLGKKDLRISVSQSVASSRSLLNEGSFFKDIDLSKNELIK